MTSPGFGIRSAGPGFKQAMQTACADLFPDDTMVSWGHPGKTHPRRMVMLMDLASAQDMATLGTNRSRNETLTLRILFVVVLNGSGWQAQRDADLAAMAMLGQLEQFCRVTDTTVGGTVRECFLTSYDLAGFTPAEEVSAGWRSYLEAVFTAQARVTGY